MSEANANEGKYFHQLPPADGDKLYSLMMDRIHEFDKMARESEAVVVKYLMTVHSGGAIAFIALVGKAELKNKMGIWPLVCFAFGLVVVGIVYGLIANRLRTVVSGFEKLVSALVSAEITIPQFKAKGDTLKNWNLCLIHSLVYLCFGLLILGLFLAYEVLK